MKVSWTKATEDEESPQVCLSFLGVPIRSLQDSSQVFLLVLYSILFPYYLFYFFFLAKKTMFSFQTLLKGTFSLLTCHLQFSITARVSMTLKGQSVQSLSDDKAARTFDVSQERGIVERVVWRKTKRSFPLVWSRWGGGGVEESE